MSLQFSTKLTFRADRNYYSRGRNRLQVSANFLGITVSFSERFYLAVPKFTKVTTSLAEKSRNLNT